MVMTGQRKVGVKVYRKIKFTYSVYGENKIFGGDAVITIHHGSFTEEPMIALDANYQTFDEAESAIIRKAMHWINDHLV